MKVIFAIIILFIMIGLFGNNSLYSYLSIVGTIAMAVATTWMALETHKSSKRDLEFRSDPLLLLRCHQEVQTDGADSKYVYLENRGNGTAYAVNWDFTPEMRKLDGDAIGTVIKRETSDLFNLEPGEKKKIFSCPKNYIEKGLDIQLTFENMFGKMENKRLDMMFHHPNPFRYIDGKQKETGHPKGEENPAGTKASS